ncbi:FliO/MopB family protein [candidate division KSB1 bacterium]
MNCKSKISVISVLLILISFAGISFAQTNNSGEVSAQSMVNTENDSVSAVTGSEGEFSFGETTKMNFTGLVLKMSLYLLLIILLITGTAFLYKKFVYNKRNGTGFGAIRILSSTYVAPKKSLLLVEAPGKMLLISVTDSQMGLITEFNKDEVDEFLKSGNPGENMRNSNGKQFSNLLNKVLKRS